MFVLGKEMEEMREKKELPLERPVRWARRHRKYLIR
jgi:hypothetical protein